MFCDILDNVADEAIRRNAIITLRVNESTDVSNFTCLLVYCRYSNEVELKDWVFMYKTPEMTSKNADDQEKWIISFNKIHSWNQVVSLCTAEPLLRSLRSSFTFMVNKQAAHNILTPCVLHRHTLAKPLSGYLKIVLKHVAERVKFIIKAQTLLRLCKVLHKVELIYFQCLKKIHTVQLCLFKIMV